jgi:nucleotide-binding universal stress UspA family protein
MKVLIAVADKHLGKAIADFVKQHPWPEKVEFKILHVVEPFPLGSTQPSYATERLIDEDRKLGLRIIGVVSSELKRALPKAQIDEEIVVGTPNNTILETAAKWPADLIVMGSHCCTRFDRVVLGSVPLSVTSHAPCSVAIVRVDQAKPLEIELCENDLPDQIREFSSI